MFHTTSSYYNCYHPNVTSPQKYLPVPLIRGNQERYQVEDKTLWLPWDNQDLYLQGDSMWYRGSNAELKISKGSLALPLISFSERCQNRFDLIFLWLSTVSSNICKGEWKNGWMNYLILTNEGLSINAYQVDLYLLFSLSQ